MKPSLEARGAEAGGDVHALRGDIAPQRLAGALQRGVAEFGGEIGHRRIHVHRAHRVADDFVLLADRLVRLVVFVAAEPVIRRVVAARRGLDVEIVRRLAAALVDEIGGEVEVLLARA